jgi:hypothetical protein
VKIESDQLTLAELFVVDPFSLLLFRALVKISRDETLVNPIIIHLHIVFRLWRLPFHILRPAVRTPKTLFQYFFQLPILHPQTLAHRLPPIDFVLNLLNLLFLCLPFVFQLLNSLVLLQYHFLLLVYFLLFYLHPF